MAKRTEDPDSLFFQRQLSIEGDTELGLGIKNLLDSLEWKEHKLSFLLNLVRTFYSKKPTLQQANVFSKH
ncbi:ubiquinone anaerobic biosynthesis accessory factor UbiT [Nitrincola nitratireducens]|uniref:Putative lipid carrier protein n=1 Tax=Nitrincola nitratireducens TaxID=1229521 RepID=W9V079_9GAMM|nr:Putative lipid carrier protein [Nitrincola nitratireducens]